MSWVNAMEPRCNELTSPDAVDMTIIPRTRDLGNFEVRRALPSVKRRLVGPFIFFDHMGPAEFINEKGIDVRPHPHIGLSTVTYLFAGEFQHRDSLGTNQMIYPGEVNWMTSGSGITHSERTSESTRMGRHTLSGIQTWVAMPEHLEDQAPSFEHHDKAALPCLEGTGKTVRLILGRAYGKTSPVRVFSDMFYADAKLRPRAKLPLPDDHEDRGLYITAGSISVAGDIFEAGQMMVFRPGDPVMIIAGERGAGLMILGGATLNGPRYIHWNFVSSSKEKIDRAMQAWRDADWGHGMFSLPDGDDQDFIPAPD